MLVSVRELSQSNALRVVMRLGVRPLEVSASPPSAAGRVGCVSHRPSSSTLSHTRTLISFRLVLPILLLAPHIAQAQTAPPPSADIQRERVEQLQELLRTKQPLLRRSHLRTAKASGAVKFAPSTSRTLPGTLLQARRLAR